MEALENTNIMFPFRFTNGQKPSLVKYCILPIDIAASVQFEVLDAVLIQHLSQSMTDYYFENNHIFHLYFGSAKYIMKYN